MDSPFFSTSSTQPIVPMEAQASSSNIIDRNDVQDPHSTEHDPYPSQSEPFPFINSWDANYIDATSLPMSSNTWTHPMASIDSTSYYNASDTPPAYNPYQSNDTGILSPQTEEPTASLAPTASATSATTLSATTAARNPTSATSRQRTFQACDKCRDRKTKCSGAKPVCERCAARGLICHYTVSKASSSRMRSKSYSSVEGAGLQQYSRPRAVARPPIPYSSSPLALKASIPSAIAAGAPPFNADINADRHQAQTFDSFFRPPNSSLHRPQSFAPSLNITPPDPSHHDAADATFRPPLHSPDTGAFEPAHAPAPEMWLPAPETWPPSPPLRVAHRPPAEGTMLALLTDDLTLRGGGEHGGYAGYSMPASAPPLQLEFVSPSPFYEEMNDAQHCHTP